MRRLLRSFQLVKFLLGYAHKLDLGLQCLRHEVSIRLKPCFIPRRVDLHFLHFFLGNKVEVSVASFNLFRHTVKAVQHRFIFGREYTFLFYFYLYTGKQAPQRADLGRRSLELFSSLSDTGNKSIRTEQASGTPERIQIA